MTIISLLQTLTLTGHSLGGILAQTIASQNSLSAYTFNALGTSGLTRFNDTSGSKILNFSYTDDGALNGDILSNALSFAGNDHLGEVIPMFGPNTGLSAHEMGYMTMVIDVYNNILNSFNSTTDYRDISQGFRSNISVSENSNVDTFTKTIEYLSEVGVYEDGVSGLKYDFLSELSASQIESKVTNNRAAMFALLKLNGFVVEGNLTAYSDMDLAKYSEKYIEKRSLFLYHMLDPHNRALGDIYIKDQANGISAGSSGFFFDNSKIIFGYDGITQGYNERLIGGSKADYLFGMDGDDTLIGNSGDDYIEGGTGNDTIHGGTGDDYIEGGKDNDVIHGNKGYDTLYGNAGVDALIGGEDTDTLYGGVGEDTLLGEAGDDILVGGDESDFYAEKEFDYLLGGSGHDTYYVSDKDVIEDDLTGAGEILFDDILLTGEKTIVQNTNGYLYEDSNYSYYVDNPKGVGRLTIFKGTITTGISSQKITINNFDATKAGGYLGITLKNKDIEITVENSTALEGNELEFKVNINQTLEKDLVLNVGSYFTGNVGDAQENDISMSADKTVTILAGKKSATYNVQTIIDNEVEGVEDFTFAVIGIEPYSGNDLENYLIKNAATGSIKDNDDENTLYIDIASVSNYEGNPGDANKLSFVVKATRELKVGEYATLDLNIYDISTNSLDYGSLSQNTITLDSTHQSVVITLDITADEDVESNSTLGNDSMYHEITKNNFMDYSLNSNIVNKISQNKKAA